MEFLHGDIDEIRIKNIFIGYVRFVFVLKDGADHGLIMIIDNPKLIIENIQEVCEQKGIVFLNEK